MLAPRPWLLAIGAAVVLAGTPSVAGDVWLVGSGKDVRIQDGPHDGTKRSFSRIAVAGGSGGFVASASRRSRDWRGSATYVGGPVVTRFTYHDGYRHGYGYGPRPHHRPYRYGHARPYRRLDHGLRHSLGHGLYGRHTHHGRLHRSYGHPHRRHHFGSGGHYRPRPHAGGHRIRHGRGGIGQIRGWRH